MFAFRINVKPMNATRKRLVVMLLPNATNIFVVKESIVLTILNVQNQITKYVVGANVLISLGLVVVQSNVLIR